MIRFLSGAIEPCTSTPKLSALPHDLVGFFVVAILALVPDNLLDLHFSSPVNIAATV